MEEARYWMWAKRKHHELGMSHDHNVLPTNNSFGDSWEEQAFAEDAARGPLGGCVWPPRSYSCSFCRREFKSAQALGGHMNVHRRDRARLKQLSPNIISPALVPEVINNLPQNHHMLNINNNPQLCTYSDQEVVIMTSSSPSSNIIRVSSSAPPLTKTTCEDKTSLTVPSFISPIIHEKSKLVSVKSKSKDIDKCSSDSNFRAKRDDDNYKVKADLSASLNLLVCRNTHTNGTEDEEISNSKRRKIDASSFTLFPRSSPVEMCHLSSPSSIEDLDLELRLGDPPKVK